jgi:hypothetical protein
MNADGHFGFQPLTSHGDFISPLLKSRYFERSIVPRSRDSPTQKISAKHRCSETDMVSAFTDLASFAD